MPAHNHHCVQSKSNWCIPLGCPVVSWRCQAYIRCTCVSQRSPTKQVCHRHRVKEVPLSPFKISAWSSHLTRTFSSLVTLTNRTVVAGIGPGPSCVTVTGSAGWERVKAEFTPVALVSCKLVKTLARSCIHGASFSQRSRHVAITSLRKHKKEQDGFVAQWHTVKLTFSSTNHSALRICWDN